jgi:cell division protein FtsL
MDKFYKILFIFVIVFIIFIVGYTFDKTVIKNDFVMIESEKLIDQSSEKQTENVTDLQSPDKINSLDTK